MSNVNIPKNFGLASGMKSSFLFIIVASVLIFLLFLNPFVIVGAGERGVVLNFGKVQEDVLGEGLHLRIPFMQKIITMDVKIQKSEIQAMASTRDLQDSSSTIVVNHHIIPDKANSIYQKIGLDYSQKVIAPSIQEVVKAVTARYNAEELITQRESISLSIKEQLTERLTAYHVIIDNLSIVNFSFSEQFTQAIEDKQTAEQRALKAAQDLKRIKIEKEQTITRAQAEAESLRLQRAVITSELLELRKIEANMKAIEKWDGKLPGVTAGAVPFLNIPSKP